MTWDVLLECGIERLPVKVSGICRKMGVRLRSYAQGYRIIQSFGLGDRLRDNDGFLFRMEGESPVIFYRQSCPVGRQRFTIAHELGHLMLGHAGLGEDGATSGGEDEERRANRFAAQLLAPACVLWGLDAVHPGQIERLCGISYQAAECQAERMKKLCARNEEFLRERGYPYFLLSAKEREVYRRFQPFMEEQKARRLL